MTDTVDARILEGFVSALLFSPTIFCFCERDARESDANGSEEAREEKM